MIVLIHKYLRREHNITRPDRSEISCLSRNRLKRMLFSQEFDAYPDVHIWLPEIKCAIKYIRINTIFHIMILLKGLTNSFCYHFILLDRSFLYISIVLFLHHLWISCINDCLFDTLHKAVISYKALLVYMDMKRPTETKSLRKEVRFRIHYANSAFSFVLVKFL